MHDVQTKGERRTAAPWRLLALTAIGPATLNILVPVLPETRPAGTVPASGLMSQEWRVLLTSAKFHGYVLAGALGSASFFTLLGGAPYVVVTVMGRTSGEFGLWFAFSSLGYMSGSFTVSRLSQRYGIDGMIAVGIACELVGAALAAALAGLPQAGPASVFMPQFAISYGNGLLLPTAIAGAVSIRPQAAGSASGMAGFTQMVVGAAATQVVTLALAGAGSALPMDWMMLAEVVMTGVAFWGLVRK